jgi:uncharacterized protein YgiM (DUF1202 family)
LLGLATFTLMLVTDTVWATQLHEGEEVVTVTNTSKVRLRSAPEIRPDTVLTRVAGGTQLKYLGTEGEWFKVGLPNNVEGWLHSRYGRLDSARDLLEVSVSVARIREGPDQNAPVLSRAIQGLMLEIVEKKGSWYKVRLPLGEEGWVQESLVTLDEVQPPLVESSLPPLEMVESDPSQLPQEGRPSDQPVSETNLLEITPLPISASAGSSQDDSESSSPSLRGPQNLDKPRFLMLFISVVAGLSAFAVILVVAAVAVRRRSEEAASTSEVEKKEEKEYADPLLRWMSTTEAATEADGNDSEQKEPVFSSSPEPPPEAVDEEVSEFDEPEPIDLKYPYISEIGEKESETLIAEKNKPSSFAIEDSSLFQEIEDEIKAEAGEKDLEETEILDQPGPESEEEQPAASDPEELDSESEPTPSETAAPTADATVDETDEEPHSPEPEESAVAPVIAIAKRDEESKTGTSRTSRSRSRRRRKSKKRRRKR